ncbi:Protocadherin-1 [Clonorchis sinensis]|uniref:Protocadherin-1 n=1 Tax=Clonorchis sinensis TaxID=79923 RepID=A0A419QA20_CLOSI|nr:Protocadherin-1 [Clonorchis sinensis]
MLTPQTNKPLILDSPRRSSMPGLRKLRVQISEEEPEGREVANLRFLVNGWSENAKSFPNRSATRIDNFQIFNSEPQSTYFQLDPTSGRLRIARRIDRDQLCPVFHSCCPRSAEDSFPMELDSSDSVTNVAMEDGTGQYLPECRLDLNIRSDDQYSNIILVHVHIVDVNDNAPIWPHAADLKDGNEQRNGQRGIIVHLSENSLIGDSTNLPSAYDADAGLNGIVRYTLKPEVPEFDLKWASDNELSGRLYTDEQQLFTPGESQYLGARHELRLVVKKLLDREQCPFYNLTITAFDGGSPSRNASTPLKVIVTDANDNSPRFQKDTYTVELMENSKPHTSVVQVTALDDDEGVNGRIKYRFSPLTKPEFMRMFTLDAVTGWIRVQWEVDYELYKKIILTVEAVDSGQLPRASTCVVEIVVLDENDHAPEIRFEPAFVTNYALVPENENPAGRLVAVFTVTDRDAGENGRVACQLAEPSRWHFQSPDPKIIKALISADPPNAFFKLQHMQVPFSVMYKLTTAAVFDREVVSQITVLIVCSDYGQPPRNTSGAVAVRITDMNDVAPKFPRERFYMNVREDVLVGSILFTVNATDVDEGRNAKLTYWLSGPDMDYFAVNENSGEISVRRPMDRELKSSLHCRIHAVDQGTPPLNSSADILVSVTDVNDNPPIITERVEFEITENHAASAPVGQLRASDRDAGRNAEVSFSLVQCLAHPLEVLTSSSDAGQGNGSWTRQVEMLYTRFLVAKDGRIFLGQAKLDRESYTAYDLIVKAEDHGQPRLTATSTVLIRILDVNDNAPTFTFPSSGNNTVYVPRSTEPGLPLTTVHAFDRDTEENGRVRYNLKGDRQGIHHDLFALDSQTGELRLRRSVDQRSPLLPEGVHSNSTQLVDNLDQHASGEASSDLYGQQSAFNLLITATDHGDPPLKSSTILRILLTPPFYPPVVKATTTDKKSPNWRHGGHENSENRKPPSLWTVGIGDIENDLTGFGILLGLVVAIGLFVCFALLAVAILLRHARALRQRNRQHTSGTEGQTNPPGDTRTVKNMQEKTSSSLKGSPAFNTFVQHPVPVDASSVFLTWTPHMETAYST